MSVGRSVVHTAFGTGVVVHVGDHDGVDAVWVDFDRGDRKMLDPKYAGSHIRLRTRRDKQTPASPTIRCDACGERPVVVTVASGADSAQFCERHLPT